MMARTRLQRYLCVSIDQMITSLVEEEPRHARSNEINSPRLAKLLVQALGVEGDEIKPSATLQGDRGRSPSTSWTLFFNGQKRG